MAEVINLAGWHEARGNFSLFAVLGQQGMRTLTGKAGKRFWMSEYGSGEYPVTDIKTGLTLSTQASHVCSESEFPSGMSTDRGVRLQVHFSGICEVILQHSKLKQQHQSFCSYDNVN